jgi:hypothetical protein
VVDEKSGVVTTLPAGEAGGVDVTGEGVVNSADPIHSTPITPDGASLFSPLLSLKPRRLAPSQSGEIVVVVMLSRSGNGVVLPGTHAKLELEPAADTPFAFGAATLDPAEPGQLSTRFVGKPVYDNTLIFRVPVTVKGDAKDAKRTVSGFVELAMVNGHTGESMGTYRTKVSGFAKIGKPLPMAVAAHKPKSARAETPTEVPGSPQVKTPTVDTKAKATAPPGSSGGGTGRLEQPTSAIDPGAALPGSPGLRAEVDDGMEMFAWIGGILAVLVIGMLVLRRRPA